MKQPAVVVHSDWSKYAAKRWQTRAMWNGSHYEISAPSPVSTLNDFFQQLQSVCNGSGKILAGFDFPIGVPVEFASKAGIQSFKQLLPQLGVGAWQSFYNIAHTSQEISLQRPFYPFAPGGKRLSRLSHLLDYLIMKRCCELAS